MTSKNHVLDISMDKKTHQKTFPLLASKMPSSDSAYTKFKQNDRTIENPGE
jgi:hypothetical protein